MADPLTHRPRRARLVAAAIAPGLGGAALTLAGVRSPVTGPLTLLFLVLTPAVCVALLLGSLAPLPRAVVAGSASPALAGSVAEVMLVTSTWSPRGGVVAVAAVCAALAAIAGVRRRRSRPAAGEDAAGSPDSDEDEDAWVFES